MSDKHVPDLAEVKAVMGELFLQDLNISIGTPEWLKKAAYDFIIHMISINPLLLNQPDNVVQQAVTVSFLLTKAAIEKDWDVEPRIINTLP
jgi:hypothetical protein